MTREDIEKCFSYHAAVAALEYYEQKYLQPRISDSVDVVDAFEDGAEWGRKKLIENACEWLRNNTTWECDFYGGNNPNKNKIEDFRKAMEE